MPDEKTEIIERTEEGSRPRSRSYIEKGAMTEGERYNQVIDAWTHARELVTEAMMKRPHATTRRDGKPYLNPICLMADSGARGITDQIRQLAGMRGLMAKPSGKIIETPIKANFREGLSVLEYFSSTHGARKGLADTALKTADSGYLTRKLADVAQNVIITEHDCGTLNGITKGVIYKGEKVEVRLSRGIIGRAARDNPSSTRHRRAHRQPRTRSSRPRRRPRIEELGFEKIRVRSPLTCESRTGICAKCYGMDLSTRPAGRGRHGRRHHRRAVHRRAGHAADDAYVPHRRNRQPRGRREPGQVRAGRSASSYPRPARRWTTPKARASPSTATAKSASWTTRAASSKRIAVPAGAIIQVAEGENVKAGQVLCSWDPHNVPILAEMAGRVRFEDIVEGETMREEIDAGSGVRRKVIVEHKGDLHPQIIVEDSTGKILGLYSDPRKGAHRGRDEAQKITRRHDPRQGRRARSRGTQDITGGLPRVTELFEARKPKDPAVISEIDGIVELGETKRRGKMTHHRPQRVRHGARAPRARTAGTCACTRATASARASRSSKGRWSPRTSSASAGEEDLQEYLSARSRTSIAART